MKVSFDEVGAQYATFRWVDGEVGDVCGIFGDSSAAIVTENDPFFGVIRHIRDGYATVQYAGFAEVHYYNDPPTVGWVYLGSDGAGGVISGYGNYTLCVSVDTEKKTAVIKL